VNEISRRAVLRSMGVALVGAPAILRGRFRVFAQSNTEYSARAIQLMGESTVVDLLNQFRFADYSQKPADKRAVWLSTPQSFTEADVATYRGSGINVFCLGDGVPDYEGGIRFFGKWNAFIAGNSETLLRISEAADFARAHRSGKIGIMLTMQNSHHFRRQEDVDEFFFLGQRISQLTHNFNNGIASGFLEQRDGGLSAFGLYIMKRMEKVGMGVDLSHLADQSTMDALDAATKPALFTHATCRTLNPGHMRAKSDEEIRKLAKTGGIMGIMFIRYVVRDQEPVGIPDVLDHFDYVRKLVGVEHLAVGSDGDIMGHATDVGANAADIDAKTPNFDRYHYHVDRKEHEAVDGLDHPKRMFDLADGLISRGYSDDEIKMILGGNAVRVLSEIWKPANPAGGPAM
jgi:membrane dipeptidase